MSSLELVVNSSPMFATALGSVNDIQHVVKMDFNQQTVYKAIKYGLERLFSS